MYGLLFYALFPAGAARADLGPENAVLVVNGDSVAAVTVANHYAAVRGLPASHVVVLRDLPSWERLTLAEFRDFVLTPTLEAVNARGIAGHADLVLSTPRRSPRRSTSGRRCGRWTRRRTRCSPRSGA